MTVGENMEKILYTTTAVNVDGLNGIAYIKENSEFEVAISSPRSPREGTNPEQLFALAYATCLNASIEFVEKQRKLEHQSSVEVTIDLTLDANGQGYLFHPSVFVKMPGREEAAAQEILEAAERQCPIHKLLKGGAVPRVELTTAYE